jgi:hypothetical protein
LHATLYLLFEGVYYPMPVPNTSVSLTVGEMARRLDQPVHRITYIVRSRNIQPASRAGALRVFTEADLAVVAEALGIQEDVPNPKRGA